MLSEKWKEGMGEMEILATSLGVVMLLLQKIILKPQPIFLSPFAARAPINLRNPENGWMCLTGSRI